LDIIIATFRRLNRQISLNNFPEKYKSKACLVVQPQEEEEARKIHSNVWVLSGDNIGYANTIKEITYEWSVNRGVYFWMMDDDLDFFKNFPEGDKGHKQAMEVSDFDEMFEETKQWLDGGLVHGALGTTWVTPWDKYPYLNNSRICGNKIYNGKELAKVWDQIDWVGCCGAEDFYVNLQLLTKGYANKVWYKYVVAPGPSYEEGGCSDYRDLEYHNNSCKDLARKFPEFVRLKENVVKSGPWKGVPKLGCHVQWKKAYQSSQQTSLKDFF
tara:strand:- start:1016 stop:1825 length:810 start_codon:yes stop_codon:yes gene_type:complete